LISYLPEEVVKWNK